MQVYEHDDELIERWQWISRRSCATSTIWRSTCCYGSHLRHFRDAELLDALRPRFADVAVRRPGWACTRTIVWLCTLALAVRGRSYAAEVSRLWRQPSWTSRLALALTYALLKFDDRFCGLPFGLTWSSALARPGSSAVLRRNASHARPPWRAPPARRGSAGRNPRAKNKPRSGLAGARISTKKSVSSAEAVLLEDLLHLLLSVADGLLDRGVVDNDRLGHVGDDQPGPHLAQRGH